MNIIIRDASFKVIDICRDLRPVATRLGKSPASRIDIWPGAGGGAQLGITWHDGVSLITDVPDFKVIRSWVEKRRRGAPVVIHARKAA